MTCEYKNRLFDFRTCDTERKGINNRELEEAAKEKGEYSFDPFNGNGYLYIEGIGWGIERK